MKLIDAFSKKQNPNDLWVILSDDGTAVLLDPEKDNLPWSTYNRAEARRMQKICEKDFKRKVHIRKLSEAVKIIASRKYGIDLLPPFTWKNLANQLMEHSIKGKINGNSNIR